MGHRCEVCGYAALKMAPENHSICPCCGTEFWTDDIDKSPEQLRLEWLQKGALWFSRMTAMPAGWNALEQLLKANMIPFSVKASSSANPPQDHIQSLRKYALSA